jgi:hypothetical protein
VFENRAPSRIFSPQGEEENGRQRKLHLKSFPTNSQGVFNKYYKNDHRAENEMQGACIRHERKDKSI